jgi:hypothetical protein
MKRQNIRLMERNCLNSKSRGDRWGKTLENLSTQPYPRLGEMHIIHNISIGASFEFTNEIILISACLLTAK